MNNCCIRINELIQNAGMSGFSIVAKRDHDLKGFFLQSRLLDDSSWTKLKSILSQTDYSGRLSLVTQIGLKYCPFCGSLLSTIIDRDKNGFDELVELHNSLAL